MGSELNTVDSKFIIGKIKRMRLQSRNELENWIKKKKTVCLRGRLINNQLIDKMAALAAPGSGSG